MIEFKHVGFSYGDTHILRDVQAHLAPGSFQFLTGPSGSGKSTFLKLCYQALMPTAGAITVLGQDAQSMNMDAIASTRRRMGVVHQDCQFLDHLSIAENILMPAQIAGRDPRADLENFNQLIEWVGLRHRINALPPALSGGERQRAALARALILSPDVILADEPTGNIDWDMGKRLLGLLVELHKMGKTVLIATHDMGLMRAAGAQTNARLLRIQDAQVLASGSDL